MRYVGHRKIGEYWLVTVSVRVWWLPWAWRLRDFMLEADSTMVCAETGAPQSLARRNAVAALVRVANTRERLRAMDLAEAERIIREHDEARKLRAVK